MAWGHCVGNRQSCHADFGMRRQVAAAYAERLTECARWHLAGCTSLSALAPIGFYSYAHDATAQAMTVHASPCMLPLGHKMKRMSAFV